MRISDWSSDVCSSDLLAIELVDQILDLGVVEVDGLHHFRQLFAQLLEAMLVAVADVLAIGQRAEAAVLKAGELGIGVGDRGETLQRVRLQQFFHRRKRKRVVFLILLGGAGRSEEHTSELQSLMRISY